MWVSSGSSTAVGAVADAAEVTVLPGDGPTARAGLHTAAARANEAASERPETDVREEPVGVRAGFGMRRLPWACGSPLPSDPWTVSHTGEAASYAGAAGGVERTLARVTTDHQSVAGDAYDVRELLVPHCQGLPGT